ncbi:MAG: prephenate dehydrogenase/arogenate dehydrogenase family protein [Nitrospirae bacterium]|nr:prephenate dehydrogenase/arogenate dehydrogenase family protein [Nitrospirota bacterium]
MGIFFNRVTIIGVGLIGGSLASVLRGKSLAGEICGIGRSEENLQKAKRLGLIDYYFCEPSEIFPGPPLVKGGLGGGIYSDGVRDSDLVILSSPVGTFLKIVKEIGTSLKKKAIVTDVGSVKGDLVREIEEALPEGVSFVGGHPIAGKETSGVEAASGELFKGSKCILTPTDRTAKDTLEIVKSMWEEAGSDVILMDPSLHDRVFATVSHLPHVIAYALVNTVARMDFGETDPLSLSVRSFRDLTRIASSPPEMWRDICLYNRVNLLNSINSFEEVLKTLKGYLEKGEEKGLLREFEEARRLKENS